MAPSEPLRFLACMTVTAKDSVWGSSNKIWMENKCVQTYIYIYTAPFRGCVGFLERTYLLYPSARRNMGLKRHVLRD